MLRDLSDTHFPDTAKIVLVQDNLNIHKPASLYEAFPAPEARRLVERFEWHYTPKHGSWLDLAESELGVLASQCLDRRIADKQILAHEVTAWHDHRNKHHAKADWQFTTANARVKLKDLHLNSSDSATTKKAPAVYGRGLYRGRGVGCYQYQRLPLLSANTPPLPCASGIHPVRCICCARELDMTATPGRSRLDGAGFLEIHSRYCTVAST